MINSVKRELLPLTLVCLLLANCSDPSGDCLQRGVCECIKAEHCPEDQDCINGSCSRLIPPPPPKREFAESCTRDHDCRSGLCLPHGPGNGGVCTRDCTLNPCPQDWTCKTRVPEDGSGTQALCVQIVESRLCHSCSVSSQCNAIGDLCLELADEYVCAQDCSLEDCPPGYACSQVQVPGGLARQCLPEGASCVCSEPTIGLTRSCSSSNQHGSCYGLSTCTEAGSGQPPEWSECEAPLARPEICNGQDDDCDGLTDAQDPGVDTSTLPDDPAYPACRKGSVLGDCIGVWTCQPAGEEAFEWICGALDPENEVCNGLDDNCDGLVDDPFLDAQGLYVHIEHCGGCGLDCRQMLPGLRLDDLGEVVEGAVACRVRTGGPACVPQLCAPGLYPYPEHQPVACAELISSACQACSQNSDCRISSDQCVAVGEDPGSFCAQSCDPASPYEGCDGSVGTQSCCPDGYTCESSPGGLRCSPDAGTCTCNPDREGITRSCFLTGGAGEVCQGLQTCMQTPEQTFTWSDCQPATVVVEVCDYLDNNCDGQVDEGFANDQGVYDTDEHCGQCNTNCVARWDQEIQHAIGGCVVQGETPACQIVACTSEFIEDYEPLLGPEAGLCRIDEDCFDYPCLDCDPVYQYCKSSGLGCCPGGQCGTSYDIEFEFVDANQEEADGCECPMLASADATDEPDVNSAYPQPGEPYVDRNCDGIDGDAARSLFVWSGSDQSLGTREHPFTGLHEALDTFQPGQYDTILVATGTYRENIVLPAQVRLYGGYSPDFSRRDIVLFPSVIQGSEPDHSDPNARPGTVYAQGITSGSTVLSGFTILGYDIHTDLAPGQTAPNSYAVYLRDCNHSLQIVNNTIIGGRGGDGADGLPGTSGVSGHDGGDGQGSWECPDSQDCDGFESTGGEGGINLTCASANGHTGATARGYSSGPQDYQSGGIDGLGGFNSSYGHSDPSQFDLCKYDCQVPGAGSSCNGADAHPGQQGSPGAGGPGCSGGGAMVDGHWRAALAAPGVAGSPGGPGGGGGAGGAVINYNAGSSCTQGNPFGDLGASGGGGGAGGCAATSGSGGGAGGGSFSVFMIVPGGQTQLPIVRANRIRRGHGGDGGQGGGGGQGGLGGQGGQGGESMLPAWCAGSAGRGGRGGDGGAGGGGGGGCGGTSVGIATNLADDEAHPSIRDNQFEAPGTDTGGSGGRGGPCPAGSTYAGGQGADGMSGDMQVY